MQRRMPKKTGRRANQCRSGITPTIWRINRKNNFEKLATNFQPTKNRAWKRPSKKCEIGWRAKISVRTSKRSANCIGDYTPLASIFTIQASAAIGLTDDDL